MANETTSVVELQFALLGSPGGVYFLPISVRRTVYDWPAANAMLHNPFLVI